MAENKVRKGFTTYLFVLLLLIVTAFLIVIVVMLFSPFKNILGLKYYSYNFDKIITNASGGQPITLETISDINFDCNSATIEIIRDTNVDNGGVRIENYSTGFATASANTDFDYKVYYTDSNSVLNIEVDEPDGFLKFSNNISITLIVAAKIDYALENTKININNTRERLLHHIIDHFADFRHIEISALFCHISAAQNDSYGRRVGTGASDAQFFHCLYKSCLCIVSRRLCKMLFRIKGLS